MRNLYHDKNRQSEKRSYVGTGRGRIKLMISHVNRNLDEMEGTREKCDRVYCNAGPKISRRNANSEWKGQTLNRWHNSSHCTLNYGQFTGIFVPRRK